MERAKRKISHIEEVIKQGQTTLNSFDEMEVIHQSLTHLNWDQVSLRTQCGELSLSSPLFINAMTGGGGKKTEEINRNLAAAAKTKNIAMAVGSQMSALKDETEKKTYEVVRKENPNGVVIANIGSEASVDQALRAIDMLEANALQIHLNVMQELIMPEGDRDFSERLKNIEQIREHVSIPLIIKEVGFGISKESAKMLKEIGIQYIDVGGKGGTSFSVIENNRRDEHLQSFNTWGIPTLISLKEVSFAYPDVNLIASGGVRHGLDGVKALILGARMFGIAGPMIRTLMEDGFDSLLTKIDSIHDEIKIAMVTLGADHISKLNNSPHVLYGRTKEWIEQRTKNV
ncbi:type 2 isopentenyl-diphosphate Delta-isomerase [Salinibacillus xinjiangensis]|uniref:Isopentenyl-diphosphate delta-isomerase n=1 Tax=Salinibacillus xinjiangensis TaxID=1229268 RepID=A0A6G1X649_9BACI|nr:type 2 isopentenyl-diphosphate Delta-isomerase [Salinibacillus xinjiangensis]MRG86417.1 type 2 isopentenyl-diphosphate Delta-isomerase [Salinibacillus xinjiangensis]